MIAKRDYKKQLFLFLTAAVLLYLFLFLLGATASAAGFVDETINTEFEYSRYAVSHYQLDFHVDKAGGFFDFLFNGLGENIVKQLHYALFCITNGIWLLSVYMSYATSSMIYEAYSLDFISDTADAVGGNIQALAGIGPNGFTSFGFYPSLLLFLVLVIGVYVLYVGLIKRQVAKVFSTLVNFLMMFVISASFIAYAPDYIKRINEFSSDISTSVLELGTKITMPNSDTKGGDSVELIRDSIFAIQVKQPWLLLQYGDSELGKIGEERVESLLSVHPGEDDGQTRQELVIQEIEGNGNQNMTMQKTVERFAQVFCIFILNIIISIFLFLLVGMMIISQLLFLVFASFLPIAFLFSMIPGQGNLMKKAVVKLFNTIMMRAGITLVITVAFSLSGMLYSISSAKPFFLIMFFQVVIFVGIYANLDKILGMFGLDGGESHRGGNRIGRGIRHFAHMQTHRMRRQFYRNASSRRKSDSGSSADKKGDKQPGPGPANRKPPVQQPQSFGEKLGQKAGNMMDLRKRAAGKIDLAKEKAKGLPTNAKYALHRGKQAAINHVEDFKQGADQRRTENQVRRNVAVGTQRADVARRRMEMNQAQYTRRDAAKPPKPTSSQASGHAVQNRKSLEGKSPPASYQEMLHNRQSKPEWQLNKTSINSQNRKPPVKTGPDRRGDRK